MTWSRLLLSTVIISLILLCGSGDASATPPVVNQIFFPNWMPVGGSSIGLISFSDQDLDVSHVQFDVADGRYEELVLEVNEMANAQMQLTFVLHCTSFAQQITLAATIVDFAGRRSVPREMVFNCGNPAIYNFESEQTEVNYIEKYIPLNMFILDDGVSELAIGAEFTTQPGLLNPTSYVKQSIRDRVVPYLNGIWDQCGLGFELVNAWVVDPDTLEISSGTLSSELFSLHEGRRVIMHGMETGTALRQGIFDLWNIASELNENASDAFNVMLVGVPIIVNQVGAFVESEGFSSSLWPNYALARLGTIIDNVVPKQMVATLAHELGHNLGLNHPGEDDLDDTIGDAFNLMKGSGVSPQPRANLLDSQCENANQYYADLQTRLALTSDQTPSENDDADVVWSKLCTNSICTGEVELAVEATGFESLDNFSFASFEYSHDDEQFYEIAVDRDYQDGFSVFWDTTTLPNGIYTIRVVVTDSKGVRVSVEAEVNIQN